VGTATAAIASDLARTGILRASINLGNPVLAQGTATATAPTGVTVDIAREVGARLGVPVRFVCFDAARKSYEAMLDSGHQHHEARRNRPVPPRPGRGPQGQGVRRRRPAPCESIRRRRPAGVAGGALVGRPSRSCESVEIDSSWKRLDRRVFGADCAWILIAEAGRYMAGGK